MMNTAGAGRFRLLLPVNDYQAVVDHMICIWPVGTDMVVCHQYGRSDLRISVSEHDGLLGI